MKQAPSKKRLDGKKKLVSLPASLERELRGYCREHRIASESELIRQAIARYITPEGYEDGTLKLQGLRDLRRLCEEIRDMLSVTFSYLKLMHTSLLAYNPEIDGALADAALKSAAMRHGRFFKSFQESLKQDPPFFEHLLHTYFTGGDDGQD